LKFQARKPLVNYYSLKKPPIAPTFLYEAYDTKQATSAVVMTERKRVSAP